jgi:hypothetical protein
MGLDPLPRHFSQPRRQRRIGGHGFNGGRQTLFRGGMTEGDGGIGDDLQISRRVTAA